MTRRTLLAGAACALAARAQNERLPRTVRLGLIGFDGHPDEVLRPLRDFPDVQLTAVADAGSDPRALASAARNPFVAKARRYATWAEMLDREQLDCAAVCNHNGGRAAAILACLEHKLPVIGEKPYATRRADWDRIVSAVKRTGTPAGMLLPMRFEPVYRAMKAVVDAGEVGEIAQIDAQKSYQLDARPEWQKNAATYGSTILWIGIHMIDLMTFTSGRKLLSAASVAARVGFPELRDMQNVTASMFRLDNGGTATLRMDYLRPASVEGHGDDRLRLAGSLGIVEYREDSGVVVISARGRRKLTDLPKAGSVFADFLRSTFAGAAPGLTWTEIVRANEATLAADEAAASGRTVAIAAGA